MTSAKGFALFNRVSDPKPEHIGFVNKVSMSMTDIKKCFDRCEDNPKKLNKVENMYFQLGHTKSKEDITAQIINSPNMAEYVENIDKYLPHLNAQKETKGLIASLDRQISSKSVDLNSAHREKGIEHILASFPKSESFTKSDLMPNYTEDGAKVLQDLKIKLAPTKESMEQGDVKGILSILKSTTPENVEFRTNFLDSNYPNFGKRVNYGENEINELSALFELADKDPATMKFLKKLNDQNAGLGRAGEYFTIIDAVGAERLADNTKAVKQCILDRRGNTTENIINHFANERPLDKFLGSIKKLFGKKQKPAVPTSDLVTISPMSKVIASSAPVEKEAVVAINAEPPKKPYVKPEIKIVPVEPTTLLPTGKIEAPVVAPVETVSVQSATPKKVKRSYLSMTPVVPQQPSAKKLVVINDVNSVIEKKLGAKTLSEQSKIYADKATKMRLSLLPEIFESIKDTRAAERANGTFKKSKSVSNADAVDLYTRINGKNKKLVNYMLKKRNTDGTRMFSVKDIMDTLADANREILKGKAGSTKLNRFTAKDERAIYDNIFEQKIAEHGKLQKTKSTKKVK